MRSENFSSNDRIYPTKVENTRRTSIPGRLDLARLHHQHHRFLRRPGPVNDATRNRYPLIRVKLDRPVLQVHEQLPAQYKEELIILVVLMPVIFPFDDPHPDNTVVYLRKGLIEPFVFANPRHFADIDRLKRIELDVQPGHIRKYLFHIMSYLVEDLAA